MQDSHERIVLDMQRARQEGFLFGAKLVRGAYLHLERGRAEEKGYPSPIHDNIEATHANYDRSATYTASLSAFLDFYFCYNACALLEHEVGTLCQTGLQRMATQAQSVV